MGIEPAMSASLHASSVPAMIPEAHLRSGKPTRHMLLAKARAQVARVDPSLPAVKAFARVCMQASSSTCNLWSTRRSPSPLAKRQLWKVITQDELGRSIHCWMSNLSMGSKAAPAGGTSCYARQIMAVSAEACISEASPVLAVLVQVR